MTEPTQRFSSRVADYVKNRPSYPPEVLDYLRSECGLTDNSVIADIGCGTGISSKLFLDNGNTVNGVEPNSAMLDAAVEFLAGYERFNAVNAPAEATTLDDASVDLITSFQSFHWFDHERVGAEFSRIAKAGAFAVIVWNERRLDETPFLIEYERLLKQHAIDYDTVRHDRVDTEMISSAISGKMTVTEFENIQYLDLDGLLGRVASSSYMPGREHPAFGLMKNDLSAIFAKYSENGKISISYRTALYCIKL